jgi:hypothetical protein
MIANTAANLLTRYVREADANSLNCFQKNSTCFRNSTNPTLCESCFM